MENDNANCILFWGQGRFRKTIPHNPESNVPIMHTAASALAYRAFATSRRCRPIFSAGNTYFRYMVQVHGLRRRDGATDKREFVAEENVNFDGDDKTKGGVSSDDKTIKT